MIKLWNNMTGRRPFLLAAALVLFSLAADSPESPHAIVITEPSLPLMATVLPATTQLGHPAVLIHSPGNEPYIDEYLTQTDAQRLWLIDPAHKAPQKWQKLQTWSQPSGTLSLQLARRCWTEPTSLVLVDDGDAQLAVAASLLATARGQPLICIHKELDAATRQWIRTLNKIEIVCVGPVSIEASDFPDGRLIRLNTLAQTFAAYESALPDQPLEHLVVIGCARDHASSNLAESDWLMPQYAVKRRAAVAMLDRTSDIEAQIEQLAAQRYPRLRYVTLWGDATSLPDEQVDDPVAAAGLETKLTEAHVAVAPLSGLTRHQPCQFRVGRITGENASSVSLTIARNLRPPGRREGEPPTALILANTDSDLPIMETITRTTAQTLERTGWQVRANYGWRTGWYKRFGRLWGADLVLYEGHTANLANSVQFDAEREPIVTGLYVFQGCKTLRQPEVTALLRNGAVGVVGTTTNTFSASGSALAKVLVDAMMLDQMDSGTSLMVARNFMLALADLKDRRGHEQGPKILRGGMTFSLWGDPTWRLPQSTAQLPDSEVVRVTVRNKLIELKIPETFAPAVRSGDYTAQIPIGAKLAGVYEWESQEHERRQLPPLYFAVVPLPDWTDDGEPQVNTPLARNRWSSLWDSRNHWLYLLVQSSARNDHDRGKRLSFRIEPAQQ